jgi:hypothetical protein
MILMTPLNIPKIVPNNWDEWWSVWNTHAKVITKARKNHNDTEGLWKGLDLYTSGRYAMPTVYAAPHAPSSPVVEDLINQIRKHIPIVLLKVRVIENLDVVLAHADHHFPKEELRGFLWNDYKEPVWTFEHNRIQKKLILPDNTNTWYYKDYPMTHSSIYTPNKSKGVLVIYGLPRTEFDEFIKNSAETFTDYSWSI